MWQIESFALIHFCVCNAQNGTVDLSLSSICCFTIAFCFLIWIHNGPFWPLKSMNLCPSSSQSLLEHGFLVRIRGK